jgi:hypothetical protein
MNWVAHDIHFQPSTSQVLRIRAQVKQVKSHVEGVKCDGYVDAGIVIDSTVFLPRLLG